MTQWPSPLQPLIPDLNKTLQIEDTTFDHFDQVLLQQPFKSVPETDWSTILNPTNILAAKVKPPTMDMSKWKLEKEYRDAYVKYIQTQKPEDLKALLKQLNPVIQKGLNTFGGGVPTLRGHAKLLAIHALQTYDPTKGSLQAHVMLHLQRLQRLLPEASNVVYTPESLRMDAIALREAEIELTDKLRRPPSDQEIADHMKISLKRLQRIRQAQGAVPSSVFENTGISILDNKRLSDKTKQMLLEVIYQELSPVQQYILEHRLGLHGHKPKSVEQIAKNLGISPARVSAHLKEIDEKLRKLEQYV